MGYYAHGAPTLVDECAALVGEIPGDAAVVDRLYRLVEHAKADDDPKSFVWIGLFQPTKAELHVVGQALALPELQLEDAANSRQRAKLEVDGPRTFVVFKALDYIEETSDVETGEFAVFVGPGYCVTVRHGPLADLRGVRARIEARDDLIRLGPVSVLYAVLDAIVDGYMSVTDEVSKDIEQVEESVFSPRRSDDSASIYRLKRENLEMRRAVMPLVPTAHQFVANNHAVVPAELHAYFHDIGDHLLRVADTIETNDQLLMTMLMAATSRQDLQQNSDMRKISAWVAIAAVPTMIAGIYG
jgi:magnesium transporter